MTLLTDEQMKKLKESWIRYPIVEDTCIGCWACVAISEEAFELDDEGKSVVKHLDSYEGKSIDDSMSACPVDSIKWEG